MVELYLHSPIRLHGVVLNQAQEQDYLLQNLGFSKRESSAGYVFHAGFLLGLLFDPEDGGDMFFRNVD
jgi:hypothetical protein